MTIFKSFLYSQTDVDALAIDTNSGNFLWVGFKQDVNGNCRIKKVSANDPGQTYFDVDITVNAIQKMIVSGTNILIGVNHSTDYIYLYPVANPLTTATIIPKPSGVNESPVDVVEGGGFLWWLFPGNASGEFGKIVKTNTFGTFQETINLQQSGDEVHNANSLTYDSNGDLWVATYTDPIELWRIYLNSAAIWALQKNQII